MTNELKDEQDSLSGTLTVLAPVGFGEKHIAPIIGGFYLEHPKLKIKLILSDHPVHTVLPEADIVIYIGELNNSSMRRVVLAKNRRLVCASPSYLTKAKKIEKPQCLNNHHCIALVENDEDTMQWLFTHKATSETFNVRIKPRLVCNIADAVKIWALNGLGIIHRSEWDVATEIADGKLQEILTDYRMPDADIVALLPNTEKERPRKVKKFIDFLKESLSEA